MGRWFDLAERYVTAFETYTQALAHERRTAAERNTSLMVLDERAVVAQERAADTVSAIQKVGQFMGGTIERLTAIETKLDLRALDTSGESEKGELTT